MPRSSGHENQSPIHSLDRRAGVVRDEVVLGEDERIVPEGIATAIAAKP